MECGLSAPLSSKHLRKMASSAGLSASVFAMLSRARPPNSRIFSGQVEQHDELFDELIHVAGRIQESVDPVHDQLHRPARPGPNHRFAQHQGFSRRPAECFAHRAAQPNVGLFNRRRTLSTEPQKWIRSSSRSERTNPISPCANAVCVGPRMLSSNVVSTIQQRRNGMNGVVLPFQPRDRSGNKQLHRGRMQKEGLGRLFGRGKGDVVGCHDASVGSRRREQGLADAPLN